MQALRCNSKPFYVRQNIYDALQELIRRGWAGLYWVDSICTYSGRSRIKHLRNLRCLFLHLEEPNLDLFWSTENVASVIIEYIRFFLIIYSHVNAIPALLTSLFLSFAALSFGILPFILPLTISTSATDSAYRSGRGNCKSLCKGASLLEILCSRHFVCLRVPVILRVHFPLILQGWHNIVFVILIVKVVLRFSSSAHCCYAV
jgi:hypothetical protein